MFFQGNICLKARVASRLRNIFCLNSAFLKALANEDTLLRTQNVSEQNQKHFLCPGPKMFTCVEKMLSFGCVCCMKMGLKHVSPVPFDKKQ